MGFKELPEVKQIYYCDIMWDREEEGKGECKREPHWWKQGQSFSQMSTHGIQMIKMLDY